jgi:hypothetical protein
LFIYFFQKDRHEHPQSPNEGMPADVLEHTSDDRSWIMFGVK